MNTTCASEPEEPCTCCPRHGKQLQQPSAPPVPYFVPVYVPVAPQPVWWSPYPYQPTTIWAYNTTATNTTTITATNTAA